LSDTKEWTQFIAFVKAFPHLKPYRTEWKIYDEDLKLAGSIDMVYENGDGTISIYDWKRCKDITKTNGFGKSAITEIINYIPDTNFWHYTLQLNTYKTILEKNYGKTVTDLYLVRLHPDNPENTYDLIKVPVLAQDMANLFEERLRNL
jgi:ATP-dependent exoDNAse (exonuclease V) beta subunit